MTTPQPRHARQRARPAAAAANRAAAQQARMPRQPRQPKPPPTFREQRAAARTRQRARLASRGATFTPEGAALAGADIGARAARDAGRARLPTGNRQYQGVILAEFLVAALIVALAPLARGKAAQDKTTGPSPYGVDDVKQLAGIGAVYFVLALLSSGKYGRFSAYFGGLVLVAIGLAQTTSGGLPAIFGIFQPSSKSAGSSDAGGVGIAEGAGSIAEQFAQNYRSAINEPPLAPGTGSPVVFTQPGVIVSDQGNVQVNP